MEKLKRENGNVVTDGEKVVVVRDDGSEFAVDLSALNNAVTTTRSERDALKSKLEAAEKALSAFGASDDDRAKAAERLKLAKSLDDKKLIDAGKVEEVVEARLKDAKAQWDKAMQAKDDLLSEANARVRRYLVSSRFATSKALEKTIITPDLAESHFGSLLDLDGDDVVWFRDASKKERLYSLTDPSKLADFDEGLSIHIQKNPNYPKWKAGTGATGGGAPGGATQTGTKVLQRKQFEAMAPAAQMEHVRTGGTVADAA